MGDGKILQRKVFRRIVIGIKIFGKVTAVDGGAAEIVADPLLLVEIEFQNLLPLFLRNLLVIEGGGFGKSPAEAQNFLCLLYTSWGR